jgi:hypothetical protein
VAQQAWLWKRTLYHRFERRPVPFSAVVHRAIECFGPAHLSHAPSNRLFLISLIRGRHRPILDLLPSLMDRAREFVHVLQEKRKRPDLLIAE